MASVRFICGTQTVHKELEARLVGVPRHRRHDPVLVVLRRQRRAVRDHPRRAGRVISDALNHASIIDGIRLCQAQRLRYDNNDMAQLEQRLQESADARYRLIATDGVFSMDGVLANLAAICDLAERTTRW